MSAPNGSRITSLRDAFISGAFLLAPLFVTIWAVHSIVDLIGGTFRPLFFFYLPDALRDRPTLTVVWDLLTTLIVIVLVTILGYVSRHFFGKFFLRLAERAFLRVPGVSSIYLTVKQMVDTFSSQNRHIFNKVVLVEFPRKGAWTLGFLTGRQQAEPQLKTGEEVWTVFVPTTPNPTSGFLLLVPPRDVVELSMSVGEGMKMILSGGGVVPPLPGPPPPAPAK
jgi:uncharacterized membrane protein